MHEDIRENEKYFDGRTRKLAKVGSHLRRIQDDFESHAGKLYNVLGGNTSSGLDVANVRRSLGQLESDPSRLERAVDSIMNDYDGEDYGGKIKVTFSC